MQKFLTLLMAAMMACGAVAETISPETALQNAMSQLRSGAMTARKAKAAGLKTSAFTLSRTATDSTDAPLYYVYTMPNGGFLIAGADTRANALLGYTDNGDFDAMQQNPAFRDWLAECEQALGTLSVPQGGSEERGQEVQRSKNKGQWSMVEGQQAKGGSQMSTVNRQLSTANGAVAASVAPLLGDIQWGQDFPYSNLTPILTKNGNSQHAPVGCAATATAQVMAYHQWPVRGQGSHTNTSYTDQSVDFSQSTYNWSKIRPQYDSEAAGDTADAVSALLYDVDCALNMEYGYDQSSAYSSDAAYALATYFGYDKIIRYEARKYHSTADWNELIQSELSANRPILVRADNPKGGAHAFVIDGYDTNGLYHVNWGWNGLSNSYFDINYLNPNQQGTGGNSNGGAYNLNQEIIVNIRKDANGTSVGQPYIRVRNHITHNSTTNTFSYQLINDGIGDFTGEAGFVLYDSLGNIADYQFYSFSDTSALHFRSYQKLEYTISEGIQLTGGYVVQPSYRWTSDGDINALDAPLSSELYLKSYRDNGAISWGYYYNTKMPKLTGSELQITRAYTGYSPRFQLKVSNSANTSIEYNDKIQIEIYRMVDGEEVDYCKGETQCFLLPGQEKTITVDCLLTMNSLRSYKDLTDGTYTYSIYYMRGVNFYRLMTGGDITMVTPDPENLSYSDMKVTKKQICQGDSLGASFTVTNAGGYTIHYYYFNIYNADGDRVCYFSAPATEVPGNSTLTVSGCGTVDYEPGSYRIFIYDGTAKEQLNDDDHPIRFYIVEPGEGLENTDANATDATAAAIYDLLGRRISEPIPGQLYIINGKKVRVAD